jgi:hypothetical protein
VPKKAEIEVELPLVKTAFAKLGTLWPECIHFRELLAYSMAELGRSDAAQKAEDADDLAVALMHAHDSGYVEFRLRRTPLVGQSGERPKASPLAQLQLTYGDRVTTMLHQNVKIQDPLGQELIRLMDGTRDRAELKAGLEQFIHAAESAARNVVSKDKLEEKLSHLARLGLVIG